MSLDVGNKHLRHMYLVMTCMIINVGLAMQKLYTFDGAIIIIGVEFVTKFVYRDNILQLNIYKRQPTF